MNEEGGWQPQSSCAEGALRTRTYPFELPEFSKQFWKSVLELGSPEGLRPLVIPAANHCVRALLAPDLAEANTSTGAAVPSPFEVELLDTRPAARAVFDAVAGFSLYSTISTIHLSKRFESTNQKGPRTSAPLLAPEGADRGDAGPRTSVHRENLLSVDTADLSAHNWRSAFHPSGELVSTKLEI